MRQFFAADFKDYLKIDKHALDDMLVNQADTFYEISEHLTSAMANRDSVKDELGQVFAETDAKVRRRAEKNGEKVTEGRVSQLVVLEKKYIKKNKEFLRAKQDLEQWQLLKEAFLQRATMIKSLVQLYSTNYFTQESISPSRGDAGKVKAKDTVVFHL